MIAFLAHLFFPTSSNNHRARLLHPKYLLIFIFLFVLGGIILTPIKHNYPSVLGVNSSITTEQLLLYTNQKRIENGLEPLTMDRRLNSAAFNKAEDMFNLDYWAHDSPEGTTPWVFIKNSGYDYTFAGENLARGFTDSEEIINAWMASPDHRKNLLSKEYKNIGFAVKKGRLKDEDTVLVVQMFGNPANELIAEDKSVQSEKTVENSYPVKQDLAQSMIAGAGASSVIDAKSTSKNISLIIIVGFIMILMLDILLIGTRKTLRFVGHNLDHVVFLSMIMVAIILLATGAII